MLFVLAFLALAFFALVFALVFAVAFFALGRFFFAFLALGRFRLARALAGFTSLCLVVFFFGRFALGFRFARAPGAVSSSDASRSFPTPEYLWRTRDEATGFFATHRFTP